uniref:Uncharacterized protein n=1 Tax=Trichobilharzia regenti TaxID=157069 RepID=A0AA85IWF8_TRIRE|nr:unnamed protein product [Trichobilharzia regenti]
MHGTLRMYPSTSKVFLIISQSKPKSQIDSSECGEYFGIRSLELSELSDEFSILVISKNYSRKYSVGFILVPLVQLLKQLGFQYQSSTLFGEQGSVPSRFGI